MGKIKKDTKKLIESIVEAMHQIKSIDVMGIDLTEIPDTVTEHFIICHADSTTQVRSIADNITKKVRENTYEKPWHIEGMDNAQWVLLDYVDVVVHIFQTESRTFYDIEGLWADAKQIKYDDKPVDK